MIKIISRKDSGKDFDERITDLLNKNAEIDLKTSRIVSDIIADVRENGDQALIDLCNRFDGVNFSSSNDLLVSKQEMKRAYDSLDQKTRDALLLAKSRIESYHKKQLPADIEYVDDAGIELANRWHAIESCGVYVPGGTAIYPSSVLMSAIPARVAGVKNIYVATPSFRGQIPQETIAACYIAQIDELYKVGGAGAIAAFAYGAGAVKKSDIIVGPGNAFVACAKRQLYGVAGIDMIAGPTDILIICSNNGANPQWIAADLLSQAEHGADSSAILITDSVEFANEVSGEIDAMLKTLSRQEIATKAIQDNSAIIIVDDLEGEGTNLANRIAPEHLEIILDSDAAAQKLSRKITNAGAIFLGKYSPEAIGDYIAGPSHTLPTMSTSRFASGLSVFTFLKRQSLISCSKKGFDQLSQAASTLAKIEGFSAHKLSVDMRK